MKYIAEHVYLISYSNAENIKANNALNEENKTHKDKIEALG